MAEATRNPHLPATGKTPEEPSALYRHCVSTYDLMYVESSEDEANGRHFRVWEGKISSLFSGLKISQSYYGRIFTTLEELGCLTKLRTGTREWKTLYALHYHPTYVEWPEGAEKRPTGRRRGTGSSSKLDVISQRLDDLVTQLSGIDIVTVLSDFEERLLRLEKAKEGSGTEAHLTRDGKDATVGNEG